MKKILVAGATGYLGRYIVKNGSGTCYRDLKEDVPVMCASVEPMLEYLLERSNMFTEINPVVYNKGCG